MKKRGILIIILLLAAMLAGRVVWGVVRVALTGATGAAFTWLRVNRPAP